MKKTKVFCFIFIFILFGCATWTMVGGKYTMSSKNFEIELPEGWRKYNLNPKALLITRDGLPLQQISIARMAIDQELAYTKKKFSKGMLAQEAAGIVEDNILSNSNIINKKIIENTPAMIGDNAGFKIIYIYQTTEGLTKKGINYGFLLDDWYYYLVYEAPAQYYFDKDLPTFEKVHKSFKIL